MDAELLFTIFNAAVLPGWLLLVFAPHWKWTERLITTVLVPLLGLAYLVLVIAYLSESDGGFGSLAQVSRLFSDPFLLLAGWLHYLAFDLFIGSWEVRTARRIGISHWLVIPCLVLTFLFGPAGLLLFLLMRALRRPSIPAERTHASA